MSSLVCRLAYTDLSHVIVILLILIPPGLFFINSMNTVKIMFPFMLGSALAIGLIVQGVLYFILTLGYMQVYYQYVAILISATSIAALYFSRDRIKLTIKASTFDFVDIVLYIGLFLGLWLFSSTYGNLFDSRVTEGLIATPLLERHSVGYANHALNYGEYPFFSIFGWPMVPVESPYKIPHLPMAGFVIRSLSVWCDGNLLFGLYLTQLFVFLSLVFTAGMLCCLLFNRYAALLVTAAFSLHFMPIDRDYLLYLPVLLSLMATEVFILIIIDQDTVEPDNNYLKIILMCISIVFLVLTHNQFLMVFSLALLVFILFTISKHGFMKTLSLHIFPMILLLISFYIALLQNKALYPSLFATNWDQRRAVIELDLFRNIGYLYPSINKDFLSFMKTIFRYDLLFVVFGMMTFIKYIFSFEMVRLKSTHIFIWSGIGISLILGNIFNYPAGNSSILFLTFGIYFLFIYGCEALSHKGTVAVILTCILITGYFMYPGFYRYWYSGNGSVPKQEYVTFRKVADILPSDAKLLLLSDTYLNLYVGYEDEPLPQNFERRTQRACEMLTGRRCFFQNSNGSADEHSLKEALQRKIMTYKLTHILTSDSHIQVHVSSGITISNKKEVAVSKDKRFYVAEIKYDKHFY